MAKQSKNLSLDAEAVWRGERYSRMHDTSLSRLVNNFLSSLPLDAEDSDVADDHLSPAVRRLLGVAEGGEGIEAYRRYLVEKYGQ